MIGEHRECLALASELLNLEPVALVQIIISENVAAYVERAREQQAELRRIIGQPKVVDGPMRLAA